MPKQDDIDSITESLLRGEFFDSKDPYEKECDDLAKKIIDGLKSTDGHTKVAAMRLRDGLKTAVFRMLHGTDDPKWVKLAYIKHALVHPYSDSPSVRGAQRPEQRSTISGPTRAIRIFCLECQGGDNAGVRECAAVNCFLWAFRMGSNPLYGRLSAEEAEAESNETEAEIEEMEASIIEVQTERLRGN